MLYQVKLSAIRPLSGSYGKVSPGAPFVTDNRTAESLMSRGLAERYRETIPTIEVRVKMMASVENKMISVRENKVDQTEPQEQPKHRGWPKGKPRKQL